MSHSNSPHTALIHILDDDSLLHIFYLYRPFLLAEDQDDDVRLTTVEPWLGEHWWYKIAHVCQRWRNVVLGSASFLRLSLLCTVGTPVADMLGHSPALPLVIDYAFSRDWDVTADEEGIFLALEQRDRICRIRLGMSITNLQKFIVAINDEYPILECLIIMHMTEDKSTILKLPETFQAPHLRHLRLISFSLPVGSRLLTTAAGLVTIFLIMGHPSTYFHPNALLQWLSLVPQLETLVITYLLPVPKRDVERQLTHMPILMPVTLPNLNCFRFRGASNYLEAIVRRITAPRLEILQIRFFNQLMFPTPRLLLFLNTTETLGFDSAKFEFSRALVSVKIYLRGEDEMYALAITVECGHLDWQVSSVAQIFNTSCQLFSTVEHLTLEHEEHSLSSEEHNEVDRTEWHKLLTSFSTAKTLRIDNGLVEGLSRALELDDEVLALQLVPELQELTYSGSSNTGDAFTSFIDARQNTDHPITVVRRSPSPDPKSFVIP